MQKYIAKRLEDGYEEEFTSLSDFARRHNLVISSISRALKRKIKRAKDWVFREEGEEFPEVEVIRCIGMRIEDGYEEIIYDKELFAKKHNLDIDKLRYATRTHRKVYSEKLPLWIFKRLDGIDKYPKVKIYVGVNLINGKEEKFANMAEFAREKNLHSANIRKIITKEKYYKSTQNWTFKCLEYGERKVY
jgi:hypothetical protein